MTLGWAQAIVLLVAFQRLEEMYRSRTNATRMVRQGGVESGQAQFPVIVVVHVGWLLALFFGVSAENIIIWPLVALYALLQPVRYWVMGSLEDRWTAKIIVLPGQPLVTDGPYRYLRHPNYLLVALEIPLLPVALGAWEIAAIFTPLVLATLIWRIRAEDRALGRSGTG
ncbi:MAG: isoprenylcysteine carboxyl methyltransferase family protein [Magnetospiraceae bacterium]